jgi:hypothetical protein
MPLTTYAEARPWARAIREEVLARRMPKWPIVRGYGDFRNDPSLSAFEIALITAWADGGAPVGTAKVRPGGAAPAGAEPQSVDPPHPHPAAGALREITVPCSSRPVPARQVLGLRPLLDPHAALRVTVARRNGTRDPLLFLREFDARFADTFWLRLPLRLEKGDRLLFERSGPGQACALALVTDR